jgi:hypothetical protein
MTMKFEGWGSQRWAIHLSQLLNAANPPDRYRFDIGRLALETSRTFYPSDPIVRVNEDELDGFAGALVPSESGKNWGILYRANQSSGKTRFTIAHEYGHYLLHRQKYPAGIHSDEAGVDGRTKIEIEREANDFASSLLMPLDDFRKQISAKDKPDFDRLSRCAERYDVSLAAAVLRWLRYTDRRALIVVSVDGFVKWAWSSTPALQSGCFIRTSRGPVELPSGSAVGRGEFTPETKAGVDHPSGVWFNEPVRELSFRTEKYDLNYTLLHFGNIDRGPALAEPHVEDTFERFNGGVIR